MLNISQRNSKQEKGLGHKEPEGFHFGSYSLRTLRNNNSSRIWSIMEREEIARKFEIPKKTNNWSDPHMKSNSEIQIGKCVRIPETNKANRFSRRNSQPFKYKRRQGLHSLYETSKDSTFGKTEKEIEEFYDNLIHKPGRKMAKLKVTPPADHHHREKAGGEMFQSCSKQQELKGALGCETRFCSRLRNNPSSHVTFTYDVLQEEVLPCPEVLCLKNDSSQMKALISPSCETENEGETDCARAVFTGKKNCSEQIAKLLEEIPEAPLPDISETQKCERRRTFDRELHKTSEAFPIGKTREELNKINKNQEIKWSKRVFPHLKTLESNWPYYQLPKFCRRRRLSKIKSLEKLNGKNVTNEFKSGKEVNPTGRTATSSSRNQRQRKLPQRSETHNGLQKVPFFPDVNQQKAFHRNKASPYYPFH